MEFSVKAKWNRVKIVLAFLAREKEGPGRELQTMLIFPHLTSPGLNRFSEEMSKKKKKNFRRTTTHGVRAFPTNFQLN